MLKKPIFCWHTEMDKNDQAWAVACHRSRHLSQKKSDVIDAWSASHQHEIPQKDPPPECTKPAVQETMQQIPKPYPISTMIITCCSQLKRPRIQRHRRPKALHTLSSVNAHSGASNCAATCACISVLIRCLTLISPFVSYYTFSVIYNSLGLSSSCLPSNCATSVFAFVTPDPPADIPFASSYCVLV